MTLPTPLAQLLRRFRAVLARWRRRGWFLLSSAVSFPDDVLARLRHRRQVWRNRLPSPPAPPVRLRLEQFESIVPLNDMLGTGLTALAGGGLLTPGILSPAPPAPPVTGEAPLGSGLGLPTDDTPSDALPTLATPIATDPVTIPGGEAATGDGTPSTNPAPNSFTAPVAVDALFQNPAAMSVLAGSGGDETAHPGPGSKSGSTNNSSMAGAGSGSPVTPSVRVNTALGMGGAGAATAGGGGMPGVGALIQTASSASAQDAGTAATGTAAAGTPLAGTSTATATGSNGPAPGTAPAATSTAPQTPASSSAPSTPSVPQVPALSQPHLPSMPQLPSVPGTPSAFNLPAAGGLANMPSLLNSSVPGAPLGPPGLPSTGPKLSAAPAGNPGPTSSLGAAPLSSPSGGNSPTGSGTPTVQFSAPIYTTPEGTSAAIAVNLSSPASQAVTVQYQTGTGTGVPGTDYQPVSGTLTFTPGQTTQRFTVPILDDGSADDAGPNETVNLTLRNPVNASLGNLQSSTLTILEEQDPPTGAFAAIEGVQFSGQVATFTGAPGRTASDFTATINWGDGTTSVGTVAANSTGGFTVSGAHTYQEEGEYAAAVQIEDLPTATASTVLALGLVVTLDQDTTLQVAGPASLTYSAGTSQSGSDNGVSFSLLESGTLNYTLQKTIYEVGDSFTSTSNVSVGFNLQESGSDVVGAFAVGSYSLGATTSDTTTRQQTANDLTNYASGSSTDSITTSIQETGNDTTGD